ncbi:MAG: PAS domain-containing protein [Candidatus Methylomirabilia bacterium]
MRVAHRLLLGLLVIFFLAGALSGTVYYLVETGHEQRRLEFLGDMMAEQVFGRLAAQMRSHRESLRPDFFSERSLPLPVRRVFLVNSSGAVRVTSDASLQGRVLARTEAGCRECHDGAARRSLIMDEALRWARPLPAEVSCRECHTAAGRYLGCLVVDLDLAGNLKEITSEIGGGLLLLLLMFVSVGGATLALARRWISRRLEAFDRVMERFEDGDLTARAEVTGRDEITRVEAGFNRMADALSDRQREHDALLVQVRAANEKLQRGEERTRRAYDIQRVLNDLLQFSLDEQPLAEVLQRCLDLVLGIPWLAVEAKGSIFVAEGDELVMLAQRGLHPTLLESCRRVDFGHCLCGRAAAERRLVFAPDVGDDHGTSYEGMVPHGHYCVPILLGQEVVGVLNLYLSAGHAQTEEEVAFLTAVANTLAGVVRRRSAEDRLRASETRFRTLAEAASDTIFIVDTESRVVFMNGTGARLLHFAPGELIGKAITALMPTAAGERLADGIARVLASGEALYREDPFSLPGGEVWLGTTLVVLPGGNGNQAGVFGISRDITAQRLAQVERERLIADLQQLLQVVSQSHKEWQSTFDGITDMISILDGDNRILKVNQACATYFGAHPRELVGRRCHEFCIAGHDQSAACPLLEAARSSGTTNQEIIDPRTGRIFRISIFPYASTGDLVDRFVHLAEDVTGEREREQQLMMSERLAALGQMASGIAHEINNPLASIAGCAEALLGRLERGRIDPGLFREYLGIVHEEVFRCKNITTAMLSSVGQRSYKLAAVRLGEALDRALELIGFQGRLRSVEVVREYLEDAPAVSASEGELRQVLLIVITNALDAMQERGTLRCRVQAADGAVTASIADTGPGIPRELMGRLFTPFHTTRAEHGGTGLGLSIAKRIIDDHRGTITIESVVGQGTTVRITLPAV